MTDQPPEPPPVFIPDLEAERVTHSRETWAQVIERLNRERFTPKEHE